MTNRRWGDTVNYDCHRFLIVQGKGAGDKYIVYESKRLDKKYNKIF